MTAENAPSSPKKLPPSTSGSHLLAQVARRVGAGGRRGAPPAAERRGQGAGPTEERQEQQEPQHRRAAGGGAAAGSAPPLYTGPVPRPGLPRAAPRGAAASLGAGPAPHVQGRALTSGASRLAAARRSARARFAVG